jgi:hypothetical protein
MYALRQHAQHLFALLLTLACPGFLTVADIKGNVGATRGKANVSLGYCPADPLDHRQNPQGSTLPRARQETA